MNELRYPLVVFDIEITHTTSIFTTAAYPPIHEIVICGDLPRVSANFVSTQAYPKQPKTYGKRLRKWRMDNRLLRTCVALLVGVHRGSIANWEQRTHLPNIKNRCKLCQLMGLKEGDEARPK